MSSELVLLPGVGHAIVCGVRTRKARCCVEGCRTPATLECDGPARPKSKSLTCDAKICTSHAKHVGPDKDLCPRCRSEAARLAQALPLAPQSPAPAIQPPCLWEDCRVCERSVAPKQTRRSGWPVCLRLGTAP